MLNIWGQTMFHKAEKGSMHILAIIGTIPIKCMRKTNSISFKIDL